MPENQREWEERMVAEYGPGILDAPRQMSSEERFAWRLALIAARNTDHADQAYDRIARMANDAEAIAHRAAEHHMHQAAAGWMTRSELYDHALRAVELLMIPDGWVRCTRCRTIARITEQGANGGFAGGTIYWANLSCGHSLVDESDDVAAAR